MGTNNATNGGTTIAFRITLALTMLVTLSCSDSTAPPKPTRVVLITGAPSTAETMVPLTIQPSLQTVDANGNPAGGSTPITATVISGPGEIEAGGTATTNATGLASFAGLTLGSVNGQVGQVTLQFSAPGLEPATTTIDLHCALLPLSVPQSVVRSLATGDCAGTTGYVNMFAVTTSQTVTAIRLMLRAAFSGNLTVQGPNEPRDIWGWTEAWDATSSNLSYKVLLPPGRSLVEVASNVDLLGQYTLTTAAASEDLTCDVTTSVGASPIASLQQLGPGDCVQSSFLEDLLLIGLPANATITASMSSAAFDPSIELRQGLNETALAHSTGQGSATLTFTNTGASAPLFLVFTSAVAGTSGAYNFTMRIAYPLGTAARSALRPAPERMRLPTTSPQHQSSVLN